MAISANALTLGQFALLSNDPLVIAVTMSIMQTRNIMSDIPFVNQQTLIMNGVRWEGNLPTVDWVKVNEEGTVTSGTPTARQEQVYVIRNYVDVDKLLVNAVNQITDPRGAQTQVYLEALACDFNNKFINNNHTTGDKDAFVGIRERLDQPAVYGVRSGNKINGGAVDMTTALTQTTFNAFQELIDELLWATNADDGTGVYLYMNEVMKRRWETGLRTYSGSGGFRVDTDQFGRGIERYRNAVVRDVGYLGDQATRVITTTETAAGVNGTSTHTSIYAVRYGENALVGWQYEPFNVENLGLMENGVIYRTLLDWSGGIFPNSNRCIARVYGIKLA